MAKLWRDSSRSRESRLGGACPPKPSDRKQTCTFALPRVLQQPERRRQPFSPRGRRSRQERCPRAAHRKGHHRCDFRPQPYFKHPWQDEPKKPKTITQTRKGRQACRRPAQQRQNGSSGSPMLCPCVAAGGEAAVASSCYGCADCIVIENRTARCQLAWQASF